MKWSILIFAAGVIGYWIGKFVYMSRLATAWHEGRIILIAKSNEPGSVEQELSDLFDRRMGNAKSQEPAKDSAPR